MCECDSEKLLTIEEAATLLQVKVGTLYSWVSKGKVPHRKVGALVRFHRGDLMAWTIERAQSIVQSQTSKRKKLQGSKLRVVQ